MATKQTNITEAIAQEVAEAARVVVQAMAMARTDNSETTQNEVLKISGTIMKQPPFNWEAEDKYSKLKTSYER